jgi:hypothetical protein
MLKLFIISVLIGQFGAIWGEILTAPGFIFAWYIKLINNLPDWIKKPIGWCHYCFAGQISLFVFIFLASDYNLLAHIVFITNTIFFTDIFTKILRYGS